MVLSVAISETFRPAHPDGERGLDFYGRPRFSHRPVAPSKMVEYDKFTAYYFTSDREPMAVEQVTEIARSHFPRSCGPAA